MGYGADLLSIARSELLDDVTVNDGTQVEAGLDGISQVASTEGQGKSSFDWHGLVLLLIVLVGALLRLYNVQWDDGQLTHPDERSTIYFYATTMHWPQDLRTALDPRQSPLNPLWDVRTQQYRSYTYGHFPLYVLVGVANGFHELGLKLQEIGLNPEAAEVLIRANQAPDLAFVGRTLMALADTAAIYLICLIARRLYGRGAGLLAAAFSAFAVLQIQLAHLFAVDPASATFTLLRIASPKRCPEPTKGSFVLLARWLACFRLR